MEYESAIRKVIVGEVMRKEQRVVRKAMAVEFMDEMESYVSNGWTVIFIEKLDGMYWAIVER